MKRYLKYAVCSLLLFFHFSGKAGDKRIELLFQKAHRVQASNFDSVIVYSDSIIRIAQSINDKHALAEAHTLKGAAYYGKGNYPETISNYQDALKLAEAGGFNDLLFPIYNLYGTFYKKQNNLKSAQEQFNNAYNLATKLKDSLQMGNALGDIGLIYELQNEWDKAGECFQKALYIHQRKKCVMCESYALSYLAEVSAYHQQYAEAINLLEQSLELKKTLKDTMGIAMIVNNMGEVYAEKGDIDKALDHFFQSLVYSQKIHYSEFIVHTYKMISDMYMKQMNYEKAYQYYQLHVNLKDSIYNEKNARNINEMEAKYQNEKKQLQIDNLNKENLLKEVKIEKQEGQTRSLYIAAALLFSIVIIVIFGYRNKQKANQIISSQKIEVEKQRDLIEAKNKEVTDSIHYAKRIQRALFASDNLLKNNLPEHFVLYKPKDIVSGDFYWASRQGDKFYLCVADCTGHGVPGAFMSLLNIAYLNEGVTEKKLESPDKILNDVRDQIIFSLSNNEIGEESKDGMDAVLCLLDLKGMWLRFSCANNPLWLLRNGELKIFKPDKMPVGKHHGEQKPFTLQTLGLRKGDTVYLLTDGYADQFGGEKGKKFKYQQLQELLVQNGTKSMEEQKELLDNTIEKWRGSLEQVDDILLIGIKF